MNGLLEALCLFIFCDLLALVGADESEIRESFNEPIGDVEDSSSGGLGAMVSRGINSASFTSSLLMSTAAVGSCYRQCVCVEGANGNRHQMYALQRRQSFLKADERLFNDLPRILGALVLQYPLPPLLLPLATGNVECLGGSMHTEYYR